MKISQTALRQAQYMMSVLNAAAAMGEFDAHFGLREGRRQVTRQDADETIALALQLEQMRTRVYETKYPELKARSMFAVETDIDPAAESFAWEETDHRGKFARIRGGGLEGDLQSVGVSSEKQTRSLASYGGIILYSLLDVRRAAFMGKPLSDRLGKASRRAWEEKLDEVVAIGDSSEGIATGATNRPTGTGATQTRSNAFTTAAWDDTPDADVMLAELHTLVRNFVLDSKETLVPDSMALPLHIFMRANTTYLTDWKGGSVLSRFAEDNGFIRRERIFSWDALKATRNGDPDSNSLDRALVWNSASDVCSTVIAQDYEILAPQQDLFGFKIPAWGRTAGFVVYQPLGLRYGTALPAT
jgi:hypothetical protein